MSDELLLIWKFQTAEEHAMADCSILPGKPTLVLTPFDVRQERGSTKRRVRRRTNSRTARAVMLMQMLGRQRLAIVLVRDAAPTCAGRPEWHSVSCQALAVLPRAEPPPCCFQARRQQNSTM